MPATQSHPEGLDQQPSKPNQHGRFRMPAESAPHAYTIMAFPSMESAESREHLKALQSEVTNIANTISRFERVHLYASEKLISQARSMVSANVSVKPATVNELWVRDSGPVFVQDLATGERTALNFNFSYWGGKLPAIGDENVAAQIATHSSEPLVTSKLTLEGGGIEHDGEGTFLGTESCIINDNRNPGISKSDVEAELQDKLGVTHFIWIPGVKGYDITDYHIDALARFISPGVVLLSKPSPNADSIAIDAYNSARSILTSANDAKGRALTVYDCEEPDTTQLGPPDKFNEVVASYANYLLVNGGVIMPKFGQEKQDSSALDLFRRLFPGREIVQVPINILPRTGGGIHCATQQVPVV
jgi:agmatine deiminase